MTDRVDEVVSREGKSPVDLKRVRGAYADLMDGKTHSDTCRCPSCLYKLHKEKRGRFDKEAFFLDWLELEVRLSLINQTEKIVFETAYDRGKNKTFIDGRDYFKSCGTLRALSNFIEKHFPDIDSNYRRIKLKLWRFRKSGVVKELEKEISFRYFRAHPAKGKEDWKDLRFAQRIADYIYSLKNREATQRELRRHFQKPIEKIEDLRPWLNGNYGIGWKR